MVSTLSSALPAGSSTCWARGSFHCPGSSTWCSATMPSWVTRMVKKHTNSPVQVRLESNHADLLEHGLLRVDRDNKLQTLSRLLRRHSGSAIIFGRTKPGVQKLNK